jgi:ribosomal protein L13E
MKQKLGRGFTLKELLSGGVHGVNYARSLGIAVDTRYI